MHPRVRQSFVFYFIVIGKARALNVRPSRMEIDSACSPIRDRCMYVLDGNIPHARVNDANDDEIALIIK